MCIRDSLPVEQCAECDGVLERSCIGPAAGGNRRVVPTCRSEIDILQRGYKRGILFHIERIGEILFFHRDVYKRQCMHFWAVWAIA